MLNLFRHPVDSASGRILAHGQMPAIEYMVEVHGSFQAIQLQMNQL